MSDDDDFDDASAGESEDDSDLSPSSDEESTSSSVANNKKKATKSPVKKTPAKSPTKAKAATAKSPAKVTGKRAATADSKSAAKVVKLNSTVPSAPAAASVAATSVPSGNDITKGPPVTTEIAAKKLILQYMRQQNRPYSALQVHDNLHKRIPKPTVERVLTTLSGEGGGLICKEYGKAKIYFVDQSTMNSTFTQDDLNDLQEGNDDLKKQLEEIKQQEKQTQHELSTLTNEPSDDELVRLIAEAEARIAEKSARLKSISSNSVAQDPNALDNAIRGFNYFRSAWLTRKQMCMGVVEMISEGMNKKVKDVLSELCVETDADVGAVLPPPMKESATRK